MSDTTDLAALLDDADLDQNATGTLQLAADTLGPAIMAGLGAITLDDINTSEVVFVTLLLDDSGSIRFGNNAQLVRDGHNMLLDALLGAKQSAAVLISCRYLNDDPQTNQGVLYPYVALTNAPRLDTHNYNPNGVTPLYDQTVVTLAGVAAKLSEFEQGGVSVRAVTVIVTDGADAGSYTFRQHDVGTIVAGLLRTEQHIIAGMGIDDGYTDFRSVFAGMGILPEWILTPGNTSSEIRAAFQTVSQSAVRASQTAGSFSQVAMGGFAP